MELDIKLLLEIGGILTSAGLVLWRSGGRTALVEKTVDDLAKQVAELSRQGQNRADSIAKTMTVEGCQARHTALDIRIEAIRSSQVTAEKAVAVLEKELVGIHESMKEMQADIKTLLSRG